MGCQVFGVGCVVFYEVFFVFVDKVVVFVLVFFGDQGICVGDVGGVELLYFYVLYINICVQCYINVVIGVDVSIGC